MSENIKNENKKSNKALIIGGSIVGVGLLSVFGYRYWKKQKEKKQALKLAKQKEAEAKLRADFDKHKKSNQKAFVQKNKKNILSVPKSNNPAQKSLIKKPVVEIKKIPPTILNYKTHARSLSSSILKKDFPTTHSLLQSLKNTFDYSVVNNEFKKLNAHKTSKSLVTASLAAFTNEMERMVLRGAFTAMGLVYDGKQFSMRPLLPQPTIITSKATQIWKDPKNFVSVPFNMVLGKRIDERGSFTLFENEQHYFLVDSSHIRVFENSGNKQ